jgi:N-acetylmuramoyl-L-alanine amidase
MQLLLLYAVKTILCAGILTGYYWLALRNKVFHHYNRFYLLSAIVLSLVLPVIKIDFWHQEQAAIPVIKLLEAADIKSEAVDEVILPGNSTSIDWLQVTGFLYLIPCGLLLLVFIQALVKIYRLYSRNEIQQTEGISLVQTDAKGTPFSFFRLIFWNRNIDIQTPTGKQILKHEIAHVQQKHSYDKLFINVSLIWLWCNPFFWIIRKELNIIHEFTADKNAVEDADTSAFAAMILQAAYPRHRFELTNPFFYSPIKRRLMMLTKNSQSKAGYISRIMVLPLAAILFVAFTFKTKVMAQTPYAGKKITVVIDAGHGGKDAGSTDGLGTYEKDIALAISKKVKILNTNSNINIILSRETDIYQTPQEKADFINKTGADLAIVIHTDATTKDSFDIKNGMSIWVAKDENPNALESKVLASALIQTFQRNYPLPIIPQPMQRNQGVWILKASKCATVLLEAGYITNKKDASFLKSEKGQDIIATNILLALEQYADLKKTGAAETLAAVQNPAEIAPVKLFTENTVGNTTISDQDNIREFDKDKALLIFNGEVIGNAQQEETGQKFKLKTAFFDNRSTESSVTQLEPYTAVKKYGKAAAHGAFEVVYKLKEGNQPSTIHGMEYIHQKEISRGLVVTLNGLLPGGIPLESASGELKLMIANSGYRIVSYTVYFMGSSFPEMLKGSSDNALLFSKTFANYLSKVNATDAISFDDIIVENAERKRERAASVSYVFTKGNAAQANGLSSAITDKKALLIINGQKSGTLESMEKKLKDLEIKITQLEFSVNIHSLLPVEAIKKYGHEGRFGAHEITIGQLALLTKM